MLRAAAALAACTAVAGVASASSEGEGDCKFYLADSKLNGELMSSWWLFFRLDLHLSILLFNNYFPIFALQGLVEAYSQE